MSRPYEDYKLMVNEINITKARLSQISHHLYMIENEEEQSLVEIMADIRVLNETLDRRSRGMNSIE